MIPPVNPSAALTIDMDLIMERLEAVSPSFGAQFLQACLSKRR